MSASNFYLFVYIWIAIGIIIFPAVLRNIAPYGRHTTTKWGPLINNKAGWIIMELPALLIFAWFFITGTNHQTFASWIFFGFWVIHYVNRTLIFPFRLRTRGNKMSMTIVVMAIGFNFVNGYINGYYLGSMSGKYVISWMWDPRFICGVALFISGLVINWQTDNILIHLRKPGETGYFIPRGGLFTFISCPNHFGEIIEWCGFALMTWSLPGMAFAIWTVVNLMPRALHHHQWYRNHFPDYPKKRKAIIPFVL